MPKPLWLYFGTTQKEISNKNILAVKKGFSRKKTGFPLKNAFSKNFNS